MPRFLPGPHCPLCGIFGTADNFCMSESSSKNRGKSGRNCTTPSQRGVRKRRKRSMDFPSLVALLNIIRKFSESCENIRRMLMQIESRGHWDWNLNGVAETPNAGVRIPENQRGCIASCGQLVRTEIQLQRMFESIDELEHSRCHDNGFQYMRGLLSALGDIVTTFHRYHARLQANYIKRGEKAGGGFHRNSRQRSKGEYTGLAEGQKSPLSIVTSIHDPELIDINATDTANNISWEEYVMRDFFSDKGGW